ncbi:MAG: hypothetical protein ACK4SA_17650 [Caldilinea sp.]
MIVIDSDVLLLAFAFSRDERQPVNRQFLSMATPRAATIYSIMEVLGKLSFNVSPNYLQQWPMWLQDTYRLNVILPRVDGQEAMSCFRREFVESPLQSMTQRMSYLDVLILQLVAATPGVEMFVTWNARHFAGKSPVPVMTPAEVLATST